eukprot:Pgem_evm1s11886
MKVTDTKVTNEANANDGDIKIYNVKLNSNGTIKSLPSELEKLLSQQNLEYQNPSQILEFL